MNYSNIIFNYPSYFPQQIQVAYPLTYETNKFSELYYPIFYSFGTSQNICTCQPSTTCTSAYQNSQSPGIKIPRSIEAKPFQKEVSYLRQQQEVISVEQPPSKICGVRSVNSLDQPTLFKQINVSNEGSKQILDNPTPDQQQLTEQKQPPRSKEERTPSLRLLQPTKQDVIDAFAIHINDDQIGNPRKIKQNKKRDYKCKHIKRQKLTNLQRAVLTNEFSRNPKWSSDKINGLSNILSLKISTIIKWNYDKKYHCDNLRINIGSSLSSGKIFAITKDQSKKFKEEQAFALFSIHSHAKKEK